MPEKKNKKKFGKVLITLATTAVLVVGAAFSAFAADAGDTELVLASIVTQSMLQGALDEVIGLLPVALPVSISFMAVRKGLSWLFGVLKRA